MEEVNSNEPVISTYQYMMSHPEKNITLILTNVRIFVSFHLFLTSSSVLLILINLFFFICILGGGVQTGSTRHVGHLLAYCTCPGWLWGWKSWWNEWKGKPKYSEKTCPDATLSTTNPTWPDPGLKPGRRGGKPATNRFSYGAAILIYYSLSLKYWIFVWHKQ
jgi:hypothetical protein